MGFRTSGSRVTAAVLSTGAEVRAETFVLAAGPWSGQSMLALGKELPIQINRFDLILQGKRPVRFRRMLEVLSPAGIEWRPAPTR